MKIWKLLLISGIAALAILVFGLCSYSSAQKSRRESGEEVESLSEAVVSSFEEEDGESAVQGEETPVPSALITGYPGTTQQNVSEPSPDMPPTPRPTLDLDSFTLPSPSSAPTAAPSPSPAAAAATPAPVQIDYSVPVISISNETYPSGTLKRNSVFSLKGNIICDVGVISEVTGEIISGGSAVQRCSFRPNASSFSLAGTVNASLHFATLDTGTYTYKLTATAVNGGKTSSKELVSSSFEIMAPAGETYISDTSSESKYVARTTSDTDNAGIIWNYFIDKFSSPYAAAGIMANIKCESSYNPSAGSGDFSNTSSYGLCQWTGERKTRLKEFAEMKGESPSSLTLQLDYIMYELDTYFPSLKSYLSSTDSGYNAAIEFCIRYEMCESTQSRGSDAKAILEKYALP